MSRILRFKKEILIHILVLIVAWLVTYFLHLSIWVYIVFVVLYLLFIFLNFKVYKIMVKQYEPFLGTKVRNADAIIIGDKIDRDDVIPSDYKAVQIYSNNMSFNSILEILKHTHSILKTNGEIIIAAKTPKSYSKFTLFDTIFFHSTTLKKYNLYQLKKFIRYPLIVNSSYIMLLFKNKHNCIISDITNEKIDKFCVERGYKVKYYC